MVSDNQKLIPVYLTPDQVDFIIGHCDSNIGAGLAILQQFSKAKGKRETLERVVELMENFKSVKLTLNQAKKDNGL